MVSYRTSIFYSRCSLLILEYVNIGGTSNRSSAGRIPNPIVNGGKTSYAILAAQVFGTSYIRFAMASSPCTSVSKNRSVFSDSLVHSLQRVVFFPLEVV